jgi:hypothetical protein
MGGGPLLQVFSGTTLLRSFNAISPESVPHQVNGQNPALPSSGLRVAATDINGDGKAELIIGAGPGQLPVTAIFDAATLAVLDDFFISDSAYLGGFFVGAA